MSKLLIIGDLHCKKTSLDVVDKILQKCREIASKDIQFTVFLGDLFHGKANIRAEAQNLLLKHFAGWPTQVALLVGNHDFTNSIECKEHSLQPFKLLPNVRVFDVPEVFGKTETFISYTPEDKLLTMMKDIIPTDLCFIHQDIAGCKYSNQMSVPSKIEKSVFEKYKRVFSGHIHLAQQIGNITYVGTPYTESFKESDEEKSVVIYDTETDDIARINLNVRQHVTFEYTIKSLDEIKGIKKELESKLSEDKVIRVIINVPEEIESGVKRSLFKGMNITLKTNKISTISRVAQVTDNLSNLETMEMYLKQLQLEPKMLAKVLKVNKSILESLNASK